MTKKNGEQPVDLAADREREVVNTVFRLALAVIFTLPLLGNRVAHALGYEVFLLADAKIQFFWGSVVQVGAGWPFYVGAYKSLRAGGVNSDVLVALGTGAAYGYSVYGAFFGSRGASGLGHVYFEVSAAVITLAFLGKLVAVMNKVGGNASSETDHRS